MSLKQLRQRLITEPRTRLVAFGSSNTDRRIHGLHWFDWLDLGIKQTLGRVHTCINTGVGGDTTRELLARFDEDVARYAPHAVFVTIGGNDANPDKALDAATYRANLLVLCEMIRDLGAVPILQTYYAADIPALGPVHGPRFQENMQIIRDVAAEIAAPLIDHHRRWEPLRLRHPDLYHALMLDALHVRPLGNALMGLDLLRTFDLHLDAHAEAHVTPARAYQALLDSLEEG
jgi:lysophospholipase L1-like esterase